MQMKKLCPIFLMIMLCMCFAANGSIQAQTIDVSPDHMGNRFHTQDGVIYWISESEAVVVDFQKGAEAITMRGTVEGLPVRCEQIVWKDGLARTIVVEEGVQGLSYIELTSFPALETADVFADVVFNRFATLDQRHVRLIACDRLTQFRIHRNVGNASARYESYYCPNVEISVLLQEMINDEHNPNTFVFTEDTDGNSDICIVPEGAQRAVIRSRYVRRIELPSTLVEVPEVVAPKLEKVTVAEGNPSFVIWEGALYSSRYFSLLLYPPARESTHLIMHPDTVLAEIKSDVLRTITLPNGFIDMAHRWRIDCPRLITLIIPETFSYEEKDIESYYGSDIRYAFSSRTADKENIWREGVTLAINADHKRVCMMDGMIYDKEGETLLFVPPSTQGDLVIPEGTEHIAIFALAGCTRIESITLPASLKPLTAASFFGLSGLHSFAVAQENEHYEARDGVLFLADESTLLARPPSHGKRYVVPQGTKRIAPYAFLANDTLTDIRMPSSVTSIGERAFFTNTALAQIALSPAIDIIGDYAFENCTSLEQLVLPKALKSVSTIVGFDEDLPYGWGLLSRRKEIVRMEIWIPETIDEIDPYAFTYAPPGGEDGRLPWDLLLVVEEGTPGHRHAVQQGLPYCFPDQVEMAREKIQYALLVGDAGEFVSVYEEPSRNVSAMAFEEGTAFPLVCELDDFFVVQVCGGYGYIQKDTCRLVEQVPCLWLTGRYESFALPLYIQTTLGDMGKTLKIEHAVDIRVVSKIGPWCRMVVDGVECYALSREMIRAIEDNEGSFIQLASRSAQLPVYAEPDESSTIVNMLNDGAGIHAYWATLDGWLYNSNGFIRIDDAGITKP